MEISEVLKTIPDYIPKERQTKIHFDPTPHKYYDDGGLVYTSVTTLLGAYKKPFNKKYWSMYTALRDCGFRVRHDNHKGQRIQIDDVWYTLDTLYNDPINSYESKLVTDEWKKITDKSIDRGNTIHNYLEDKINESKGDTEGETNRNVSPLSSLQGELIVIHTKHDLEATGLQYSNPSIFFRLSEYIRMGCTLYAEKRIYSIAFQVAGTVDVLIVKGKEFAILDWKTNKDEIKFVSGYYRKVRMPDGKYVKTADFVPKDDRLFEPIDHLQDCKGIVYGLQISLYAFILILWGFKLVKNGLEICHMRPGDKPRFLRIPFMARECRDILMHHYHNRVLDNVAATPGDANNGIFTIK